MKLKNLYKIYKLLNQINSEEEFMDIMHYIRNTWCIYCGKKFENFGETCTCMRDD